jgi:GMP synthase (glutamine-hydrolysing)
MLLGGSVKQADKREYGFAELQQKPEGVFKGITNFHLDDHGDSIVKLPKGFQLLATTNNTPIAAATFPQKNLYGLRFHPEVEHTAKVKRYLGIFC